MKTDSIHAPGDKNILEGVSIACLHPCRLLQDLLAPILLRRMKEDVETLPEKEVGEGI
jgi:SNF2 family DNA or RNA helicase